MLTENDVKARVTKILAENGLTENKLAGGNASTQKRLNRQLSHGAAMTVETLLMVLDACPNVSADWLLRGMPFVPPVDLSVVGDNNIAHNKNTTVNDADTTKYLIAQLEEKDKQIARLLKIIESK